MMPLPQATPAPIHDIVGPVPFLPVPVWMIVAGAAAGLAALGWLAWFFFLRRKPAQGPTPAEAARAALDALRPRAATDEPYAFSIAVSDILRTFLRDERGLRATTQTSIEFLESVRARGTFAPDEQAALERFLEKADLIKFARVHATGDDSRDLLGAAEHLVESSMAEAGRFDTPANAGGRP